MATVRLIIVVLVLGLVVLLGVQNLAPELPLIFFGSGTQALPLGVWLVGAVLLGALTTLVLTALLGSLRGSAGRSSGYKYRPQSFYEPAGSSSDPSVSRTASDRPSPPPYTNPASRSAGSGRSPSTPGDSSQGGDAADDDPSWRAWTNLKAPDRWSDWESLSQAPRPDSSATNAASGVLDGVTTWFSSSKQRAKQRQRVDDSLQELDTDWDGLENQPYTPPGGSPVQDSLNEIAQGWNDAPSRDFEAQAPRRVYQDGSLYSYSYREENTPAPSGQVDSIYAPPDDVGHAPPLGAPELAEDGVVDADYRVIVPPYNAEPAVTSRPEGSDDTPNNPAGDEWDEA
ncbi:MAG: hypothetical protein WBB18_10495, partial [Nodosilinea sp.]